LHTNTEKIVQTSISVLLGLSGITRSTSNFIHFWTALCSC